MKKLVPGILATLMCFACVATACDNNKPDDGSSTPAVTYDVAAAKNYVKAQYIDTIGVSRADYKVVNSVVVGGHTYTVDWSVDVDSGVAIKEFSNYTKIDCDQALSADLDYVLTATVTAPDGTTATQEFEGTVVAMSATVAAPISAAPVDGTAYKFYVFQGATGNDCYINGKMKNTYYFATVYEYEDGIDLYSEATEGGFYLYHNVVDGDTTTKTYINVVKSGTHTNAKYQTTASTVWTWDADYGTIVTELSDGTWYLGCDGTYETVEPQNSTDDTYYKGYLVNIADRTTVSEANKIMDAYNKLSLSPIFVDECEFELPEQGDVFPEVKIAWAVKEGTANVENGILKLASVTETAQVTLTATLTIGSETRTKDITINHVPNNTKAMLEAASLLKSGQKFPTPMTVTGKVTSIKDAYNPQYANVTIVIDVEGVAIECFRLAGVGADIVDVNDTVTVTGTIEMYNSTVQFGQGCTLDSHVAYPYTAAEKVAIEKEAIEVETTVNGAAEITLPTETIKFNDVTITWALTASDIATLEGNVLTIAEASEATTVTVTATIACGDVTDTKIIEITADSNALVERSLSFADTANRTTFTTSQQVWEQNGVKLTNDKAGSSSNVADYSNPARFYKGSTVTVECTGMKEISFTCNNATYASALAASIAADSNYTVETTDKVVKVTFVSAVDSFNVGAASAQYRVDSLVVLAK